MEQRIIKFRLRQDNKIVGYERWMALGQKGRWEYSEDNQMFHWTEQFIPHNKKDSFTNLPDKNGREIYEGDIVMDGWNDNNVGQVTFDGGSFNLGIGYVEVMEIQSEDCEIIGNIWENPELLEEKKDE